MRSGVLAFALLFGCGQVDKGPFDAPSPDAYQADAPATCSGSQMLCGAACEDVMASAAHCGNCDTQCNALEYCGAGSCKRFGSCADYKAASPTAVNGVYQSTAKVESFYCDFTAGQQYEFFMYDYTLMPQPGFALMHATDFQNAATAAAFIGLYNANNGLKVFAVWVSNNCCYSTEGGLDLTFNGANQTPSAACNPAGGYIDPVYTLTGLPPPLAATFFQTNAPGESAICADANNPGIWMRKTAF